MRKRDNMNKKNPNYGKTSLTTLDNNNEEAHSSTHVEVKIIGTTLIRETRTEKFLMLESGKVTPRGIPIYEKEIIDSDIRIEEYPLTEVPVQKLAALKAKMKPIFIMKEGGKYYYTFIPKSFRLIGTLKEEHLCAPFGTVCDRLNALPFENGGCDKVYRKEKNLEDFEWIRKGYQTEHTTNDSFIVRGCDHHKIISPKRESKRVKDSIKLELAMHLWDDVDDVDQMKERTRKNLRIIKEDA